MRKTELRGYAREIAEAIVNGYSIEDEPRAYSGYDISAAASIRGKPVDARSEGNQISVDVFGTKPRVERYLAHIGGVGFLPIEGKVNVGRYGHEIGRASCRDRGEMGWIAG